MTKFMDELVEIGVQALAVEDGGFKRGQAPDAMDEDARYLFTTETKAVLNAVLPVLAQRMMKPTGYMVREGSGVQNTALTLTTGDGPPLTFQAKIGRASCRERV